MPKYRVELDGRSFVFEGDHPPTEAEARAAIGQLDSSAHQSAPEAEPEAPKPGLLSDPLGYAKETLSNIIPSAENAIVDIAKGIPAGLQAAGRIINDANPDAVAERLATALREKPTSVRDAVATATNVANPTAAAMAEGLAKHYYDRFGGLHKASATLRDDPVGALLDIAPVGKPLEMLGAAGKAEVASRAMKAAEIAADALPDTARLNRSARNTRIVMDAVNRREASPLYKAANAAEKVGAAIDKPITTLADVTIPIAGKLANRVRNVGTKAMVRAAKPTLAEMEDMPAGRRNDITGARQEFVNSLADNDAGLNYKGVEKVREAIDENRQQLKDIVDSHLEHDLAMDERGNLTFGEPISVANVERPLNELRDKLRKQVNPTADLEAIEKVRQDFRRSIGLPEDVVTGRSPLEDASIPFDQAHEMKQGTYQHLRDKFGEMSNAQAQAQKALAAGLSNQVSRVMRDTGYTNTNLKLSQLYPTERALKKVVNRLETSQPFGLRDLVGVGGLASLPTAVASGNPALIAGALGGVAVQASRPEILFPAGKAIYNIGKRAQTMQYSTVEHASRVALLARLIANATDISEEEATRVAEAEISKQENTIK